MNVPTRCLLLIAFSVPAPAALAQHVVFSEGFESGLGAWTTSGLWTPQSSSDLCGATVAPFPEGTQCAWYGEQPSCTYATGSSPNAGMMVQNDWVQLPDAASITVHFWNYIQSEYCYTEGGTTPYDAPTVTITSESGGSLVQQQCSILIQQAISLIPWHERQIDISAFRGQRVKLSFGFDTIDAWRNNLFGWMVDDLQILAEPGERVCPSAALTSGCPCMPPFVPVAGGCRNSTQQSCTLFTSGVPSVTADTLQLRAEHMPPVASAILAQSTGTGAPVLFGDGLRCVSGQILRMGSLAASAGVGTWPLPGESISVRGLIPAAGATRYYYVQYRDVVAYCTPATSNLSDARRVVWAP